GKTGDLFPSTLIRPARQGHGTMPKEKFAMRGDRCAAKSTGTHFAKIGDALRAQINLQDMVAGGFVEAGKDLGIFDGLKSVQDASAQQAHAFLAIAAPNDRRALGA